MEAEQLKAVTRIETGKCPARRLRSTGMIPAILYGPKIQSMKLAVNAAELKRLLVHKSDKKFYRLLIEDGDKTIDKLSIVKKYETHPLGGQLIHADFYEISMDQKVSLDVPVFTTGTPIGLELGGELQHLKRMLHVSGLPDVLPEKIVVDVSHLKVGDTLKVRDIPVPEGITIQDAAEVTVVCVLSTRATLKALDEQPGSVQADAQKAKAPEKKAAPKKK